MWPWRPRASFVPHASREGALGFDRARSSFFHLLSGSWRFRWVRNPFELPAGFELPGYDDTGWDTIAVPSNWQVVGANENRPYDRPFFSNISILVVSKGAEAGAALSSLTASASKSKG